MKRLLFIVIFWSFAVTAFAATTFVWQPNTETDLAGYRLYCNTIIKDTGLPPTINGEVTYPIKNVTTIDGVYTCHLTAYDTSGNESEASNIVNFTLDTAAPAVPDGFGVR